MSIFDQPLLGDFAAFPIGQRVTVAVTMQDHHFFRVGEPGCVVRNRGRYLGVIVAFDNPWICDHGNGRHEMAEFNFNPSDLAAIAAGGGG